MSDIRELISKMPKAELHVHIEGTFEPELIFEIAKRNNITLDYSSVDELKSAYKFNNLQEFLDIYYLGAKVLLHEQDFYDLTFAYLQKCKEQNVIHTEIMFDPQTHTDRGVPFETVINGIWNAMQDAQEKFGISSLLIMNFLRHLSEDAAMKTLRESLPYKDKITSVGLDSSELGNPPEKFKEVFAEAKKHGFLLQAHAGEEGPPQYIWDSLNILKVDRIDHGNRCLEDEKLVDELVKRKIYMTICPLSNLCLRGVQNMKSHPLKTMLDKNLLVTVNSDDPSYFGGYLNENYFAVQEALDLNKDEIFVLSKNGFMASFLPDSDKLKLIGELGLFFGKS